MTMAKRNPRPPIEELDEYGREFFYPDYGRVQGESLTSHIICDDSTIDRMGADELREELRSLNRAYMQTWLKMEQYRLYVPDEIKNRDPSATVAILFLLEKGHSDEEIAMELNETVRFVQRARLDLDGGTGIFKRKRGRPPKE